MAQYLDTLRWRGLLHDATPEAEDLLASKKVTGYVGFDPTADSLHVGSLAPIMMLRHFQEHGHTPIALCGGATGMIGDPSGKSEERNLLSEEVLRHNIDCIGRQLGQFLDFDGRAKLVNNYDWFKGMGFLEFIRDVGKHITVNYMMAKDSVKTRLESGLSFTEFSYQLAQGYDFLHLYRTMQAEMQLGGSDQWGNMLTGTELIRRIEGGKAHVATCPLITKSDGSKMGKTERGNVWLDPKRTSPYRFYQFWINAADEDAATWIRIFTELPQEETEDIIRQHQEAPGRRELQKVLAREITSMVHSKEAWESAVATSDILFGKGSGEAIFGLSEDQILDAMDGLPTYNISRSAIETGVGILDLVADHSEVFPSKGEARRTVTGGGLSMNKTKVTDPSAIVRDNDLICGKYLLLQRGKKNYYLLVAG